MYHNRKITQSHASQHMQETQMTWPGFEWQLYDFNIPQFFSFKV